jgi:hypothetical protein
MDNLALGDQLEDFMICCDDISDKSTDTWKTGLELHEDSQTTLSSCSIKFDNQYQVLMSTLAEFFPLLEARISLIRCFFEVCEIVYLALC